MATHSSSTVAPPVRGKKFFTVAEANRALPYVRRIVLDIRQSYRDALALQHKMQFPLSEQSVRELDAEYDRVMEKLNSYIDELTQVGVEHKDCETGLVDFPANHEGREVCLCWKLGEQSLTTWHELEAGFADRQSVNTLQPHTPDCTGEHAPDNAAQ